MTLIEILKNWSETWVSESTEGCDYGFSLQKSGKVWKLKAWTYDTFSNISEWRANGLESFPLLVEEYPEGLDYKDDWGVETEDL